MKPISSTVSLEDLKLSPAWTIYRFLAALSEPTAELFPVKIRKESR